MIPSIENLIFNCLNISIWCFLHLKRQTGIEISSHCHDNKFPPSSVGGEANATLLYLTSLIADN